MALSASALLPRILPIHHVGRASMLEETAKPPCWEGQHAGTNDFVHYYHLCWCSSGVVLQFELRFVNASDANPPCWEGQRAGRPGETTMLGRPACWKRDLEKGWQRRSISKHCLWRYSTPQLGGIPYRSSRRCRIRVERIAARICASREEEPDLGGAIQITRDR